MVRICTICVLLLCLMDGVASKATTDSLGSDGDDEHDGLEDPTAETENDQVNFSRGPYWTNPKRMKKKVYAVHATRPAVFQCRAKGNPMPSIHWLKNGQEFSGEHRVGGIKLKHQHSSLVIDSVVMSDRGNYTCVVENKYGSITHTYVLDVIAPPPRKPKVQAVLPANTTAVVGSDVQFYCEVQSDIWVHIQWLKHIEVNGSNIGPDGFPHIKVLKTVRLSMSGDDVLYLYKVTMEDAGLYSCLASNVLGFSHGAFRLTVIPEEKVTDAVETNHTDIGCHKQHPEAADENLTLPQKVFQLFSDLRQFLSQS